MLCPPLRGLSINSDVDTRNEFVFVKNVELKHIKSIVEWLRQYQSEKCTWRVHSSIDKGARSFSSRICVAGILVTSRVQENPHAS